MMRNSLDPMATLAFISDAHLGYRHRFKKQRIFDYQRCFDQAAEQALSYDPDAVVILGDLTHHSKPDPVTMRAAIAGLLRIAQKCPVIVCVGNHEITGHLSTAYTPIFADLSPNIHVLTSEDPYADVEADGKTYRFVGFEYTRNPKTASANLKEAKLAANGDVNILCLHQAIERYLSPPELGLAELTDAAGSFDLVMCGHVHKHQRITQVFDEAPAYYCGATERVSFNECDNETGFMLFENDDFDAPKFIKTDSTPMLNVRREFSGTVSELNDMVRKIITDSTHPLLRIEVSGRIVGDLMDVNRDYADIAGQKTILDIIVNPESAQRPERLVRLTLSEDLIKEYFEKADMSSDLLDTSLDLFRRYGA